MIFAVRIVLSIVLVYGVYTETGLWTAVFAALITIGIELAAMQIAILIKQVRELRGKRRLP